MSQFREANFRNPEFGGSRRSSSFKRGTPCRQPECDQYPATAILC